MTVGGRYRAESISAAWFLTGSAPPGSLSYSIDEGVYGERHPSGATALSNLGSVWDALGDHKKARPYFQHAYDIFGEFYGDEHPDSKVAKEWLDRLRDNTKRVHFGEVAYLVERREIPSICGTQHPALSRRKWRYSAVVRREEATNGEAQGNSETSGCSQHKGSPLEEISFMGESLREGAGQKIVAGRENQAL